MFLSVGALLKLIVPLQLRILAYGPAYIFKWNHIITKASASLIMLMIY